MILTLDVVLRRGVGGEGGGEVVVANEEIGEGESARSPWANRRQAGRSSWKLSRWTAGPAPG